MVGTDSESNCVLQHHTQGVCTPWYTLSHDLNIKCSHGYQYFCVHRQLGHKSSDLINGTIHPWGSKVVLETVGGKASLSPRDMPLLSGRGLLVLVLYSQSAPWPLWGKERSCHALPQLVHRHKRTKWAWTDTPKSLKWTLPPFCCWRGVYSGLGGWETKEQSPFSCCPPRKFVEVAENCWPMICSWAQLWINE